MMSKIEYAAWLTAIVVVSVALIVEGLK